MIHIGAGQNYTDGEVFNVLAIAPIAKKFLELIVKLSDYVSRAAILSIGVEVEVIFIARQG